MVQRRKQKKFTWCSAIFLECVSLLGIVAVAQPESTLRVLRSLVGKVDRSEPTPLEGPTPDQPHVELEPESALVAHEAQVYPRHILSPPELLQGFYPQHRDGVSLLSGPFQERTRFDNQRFVPSLFRRGAQ